MLKLETEVIQVSAEGSVKHLLLPSIDIEEQERTKCDKICFILAAPYQQTIKYNRKESQSFPDFQVSYYFIKISRERKSHREILCENHNISKIFILWDFVFVGIGILYPVNYIYTVNRLHLKYKSIMNNVNITVLLLAYTGNWNGSDEYQSIDPVNER